MADTKSNRPQPSKEGGQVLAHRERESGAVQHRADAGEWFAAPFELMERMSQEMDRTFGRMFREFGMPQWSRRGRASFGSAGRADLWAPRIEAVQKGDRFIVRADLPGLKKDDVRVDLSDDAVTIQGERREEHEDQREGYFHSEREYGQFSRTIPLPEGVITESAEASFKDGVLEVSMQAPPVEATRGRRLDIRDASEAGEKKQ